jgi:hypothetical protein
VLLEQLQLQEPRTVKGFAIRVARIHKDHLALLRAQCERAEAMLNRPDVKDRAIINVIEMVNCFQIAMVPPDVADAAAPLLADRAALPAGVAISAEAVAVKTRIATMQLETLTWLQAFFKTTAAQISPQLFAQLARRVVFLPSLEGREDFLYEGADENVTRFLRFHPVLHGDALTLVVVLGIIDFPFSCNDALHMANDLVVRSLPLHLACGEALKVDQLSLLEAIPKLAGVWQSPDETLTLASAPLYAQAWRVMLLLAAANPATIGAVGWREYPTLRTLMEMAVTGEFEQHDLTGLALPLTEEEATLLPGPDVLFVDTSKCVALASKGPTRLLAPDFLASIAALCRAHKVGLALCRSRDPDYLVELISLRGHAASVSWLTPLVSTRADILDALPVSLICELLAGLMEADKATQVPQLMVARLRNAMHESQSSYVDIGRFFLERLSRWTTVRAAATHQLLADLFSSSSTPTNQSDTRMLGTAWLGGLTASPWAVSLQPTLIEALLAAMPIEQSAVVACAYAEYVLLHLPIESATLGPGAGPSKSKKAASPGTSSAPLAAASQVASILATRPLVLAQLVTLPSSVDLLNALYSLFTRESTGNNMLAALGLACGDLSVPLTDARSRAVPETIVSIVALLTPSMHQALAGRPVLWTRALCCCNPAAIAALLSHAPLAAVLQAPVTPGMSGDRIHRVLQFLNMQASIEAHPTSSSLGPTIARMWQTVPWHMRALERLVRSASTSAQSTPLPALLTLLSQHQPILPPTKPVLSQATITHPIATDAVAPMETDSLPAFSSQDPSKLLLVLLGPSAPLAQSRAFQRLSRSLKTDSTFAPALLAALHAHVRTHGPLTVQQAVFTPIIVRQLTTHVMVSLIFFSFS